MSHDTSTQHPGLQSLLYGSRAADALTGSEARTVNFGACRALAEMVRTTLGPNGLDKLLITSDGKAIVTNDGASIIDRMEIDHPAGEMLVRVAESQARSGDGTTTAVVLAGELLTAAETLLERGVHQTTVIQGYSLATSRAREALREQAVTVEPADTQQLRDIAETVITGKWDGDASEFLAGKTVDAVSAVRQEEGVSFEKITRKAIPGRSYYDSEIIDGIIINLDTSSTTAVSPETELPRTFTDATVALVDDQLTIESATGQGAVNPETPDQLQAFRDYERDVYENHVERIVAAGADVVFCQKSIDDPVRYLLADEGVLAVERTRQDELHKLARATGAHVVGSVFDLRPEDVGRATAFERRDLGTTELAVVTGSRNVDQVSLLLRGGTEHVADETKRVIDSCFYVLKHALEDGFVLPGGGAAEIHVARTLREYATSVSGKEQLAIEAYADAIEVVPRTLAESAGFDPIDVLVELRTAHHDGTVTAGLTLDTGGTGDMLSRGVIEPLAVKERALVSASEATNLLVRVDDVLPSSHDGGDHHDEHHDEHDHQHGPGGLVESPHGYPWTLGH